MLPAPDSLIAPSILADVLDVTVTVYQRTAWWRIVSTRRAEEDTHYAFIEYYSSHVKYTFLQRTEPDYSTLYGEPVRIAVNVTRKTVWDKKYTAATTTTVILPPFYLLAMSIHLNKSVIRWRCWPIEIITHRHPFDGNANRLVRSFGSATSTYSNNSSKSKNCKNNSFDNLSTNNTRNIMQFQVTSSNVSLPSGSIIIRSRLFSSSKSDEDLTATTTSTTTATKTEDGVVRNNDEHTGTQINIIVEEEGKFAKKEKTDITDRSKYTDEVKIRMPDIGDGKGKILRWFRNEGDIVRYEDVLCDIETEGT